MGRRSTAETASRLDRAIRCACAIEMTSMTSLQSVGHTQCELVDDKVVDRCSHRARVARLASDEVPFERSRSCRRPGIALDDRGEHARARPRGTFR
jgi:hypothetical protein